MGLDILIGLLVIAAIVIGGYVLTHHKAPAVPSPASLATTLSTTVQDSWATVKEDLPGLVSSRVAELEAALAVALKRADDAEAQIAVEQKAKATAMAAMDQVKAAVATVGATPVTAPVAPNPTQGV